jgi:hypothetical protein
MESERAQNFNDRLNQWIAAQGFWFQLRYSMLGAGGGGARGAQTLQMAVRVFIFLIIVGLAGLVYLIKRTDGEGFRKRMETKLVGELGAQKGKLGSFQRSQGKLVISQLAATGGEGTFFTALDARNVSCQMGLFSGLVGKWAPGNVTITKLDIDLRAGTQDAASAETLGHALFKERPDLELKTIEVEDATVSWGFSALTRGVIEGSHLAIRRSGADWRMQFKGGKFSQNWLRGLEIQELVVTCGRGGITFDKALFKDGDGTADLKGLTILGTEKPAVSGLLKLKHLPLEGVLATVAGNFLEGWVSGELKVSGSTNSPEGIGFEGRLALADEDELTLRDRLPLLRALSVVDVFNNYRRVTFRQGSLMLKTSGGNLTLSEVALKADDLLTLHGHLNLRNPTQDEMRRKVANDAQERSPIFSAQNAESDPTVASSSDFTLKRAGKETEKTGDKKDADDNDEFFDRNEARQQERKTERDAAERIASALQYEGEFEITLRADSFERSEKLRLEYPVDPKTNRIGIKVPISGTLSDLTLKQAEEIHEKGRR